MFQQFNLIPVLNVYENIVLPMKLDGRPISVEITDSAFTHVVYNQPDNSCGDV